ncbi:MAG: hypothetical protein JW738_09980 [Actinobacteria bacterium]|nr:hypothetical protein [Actinomycetota bacterium]
MKRHEAIIHQNPGDSIAATDMNIRSELTLNNSFMLKMLTAPCDINIRS